MNNITERKALLLTELGFTGEEIERIRTGAAELGDLIGARMRESMNDPNDTTQCAIVCQSIRLDGVSYDTMDPEPYLRQISELKERGGKFATDVPGYRNQSRPDVSDHNTAGTAQSFRPYGTDPGQVPYNDSQHPAYGQTGQGPYRPGPAPQDPAASQNGASGPTYQAQFAVNRGAFVCIHPFRRFIARCIDFFICFVVINILFRFVFRLDPAVRLGATISTVTYASVYCAYGLMFLIEPLLLYRFSSTPGKALLGLRLTTPDGGRIRISDGYIRCIQVLIFGFGCMLPILNLFRLGDSFVRCKSGQPLIWEKNSLMTLRTDSRPLRIVLSIVVFLSVSFIDQFLGTYAALPSNRGPLTEEMFYDNCAELSRYNMLGTAELGSDSKYSAVTVNGTVSSVTFELSLQAADTVPDTYYPMYIALMSFVGASEDIRPYSFVSTDIPYILNDCYADFDQQLNGYRITNVIDSKGYVKNILSGFMYSNGSEDAYFHQTFTITRLQ